MAAAYAKILLFGEHIVLQGAEALAIPWPAFQANWAWSTTADQQDLPQWAIYLQNLQQQKKLLAPLDLRAFQQDLQNGLYLASSIPTGYGAGSSGALCAALYKRYQTENAPDDLLALRQQLAQLEGFFHGSSSGTDPLICYLEQAIHITADQSIQAFDWTWKSTGNLNFFVIDTGIKRQTGPWVEAFKAQTELADFRQKMQEQLIPASNQAIQNLLQNDPAHLYNNFQTISHFHFHLLRNWIPAPFHQLWQQGLDTGDYLLKICGAGGGGFILGISPDTDQLSRLQTQYPILRLH